MNTGGGGYNRDQGSPEEQRRTTQSVGLSLAPQDRSEWIFCFCEHLNSVNGGGGYKFG